MRLVQRSLATLVAALLVPLGGLGFVLSYAIRDIGNRAADHAFHAQVVSERGRLLEATRGMSEEIGGYLGRFERDASHLRMSFEARTLAPAPGDVLYPDRDTAGLGGSGFVDPRWQAYADFELRGKGCPWARRSVVARARGDEVFRDRVRTRLQQALAFSPVFQRIVEEHKAAVDLAWIVFVDGVTNVHPPYEYARLLEERPQLLDLDEREEDYVRLLDPVNNPARRTRWLGPYLDPFKGTWMTSCAAPLYEGGEFVGSVGMDILLPVITERVQQLNPGHRGYAFLIGSGGRLVAVPDIGIEDLAWSVAHRQALKALTGPGAQRVEADSASRQALDISLVDSPEPEVRGLVTAMLGGASGTLEITLGGQPKYAAFSPIGRTGWSLGMVLPKEEVEASVRAVRDTIEEVTDHRARIVLPVIGLVLAVSLVFGGLLHTWIVVPVARLGRTMESVRWDQLDLPLGFKPRRDEVGQLYERFREMLRVLRAARDEGMAKERALEAAVQELRHEVGERLLAESALSREKELLSVTLRSIGDGVVATDAAGRVVLLNPVAEHLTGWAEADARGRPLAQVFPLLHATDRSTAPDVTRRVLEEGGVPASERSLLVARGGQERIVALGGSRIRDSRGETLGVVVVVRDMTEACRLEEEMIRIGKLESVRVLAAGIAHDFNNLLTAITANLGLARQLYAEEGAGGEGAFVHRMEEAERASGRARHLTEQLLTFSTGGKPVRRVVDLPALLKETASFAVRGSQARCEFEMAPDLAPVSVDEGQIGQVVSNLVLNAEQAMPGGGVIRVRARNVELDPARLLALSSTARSPRPFVEVSVEDGGEGIPAHILPRIFDPFFTTKARGTGLGLAVCFSIIRQHEGLLEADSTPGQGSVFRFYLPAADRAPSPDTTAPGLVRGTGRVLVMDDDDAVREALVEMLKFLGYDAEGVADGALAVERYLAAGREERPFDVVILDLTVPGGMGGRETLARLREQDPGVRAIVSSGYSHDPIVSEHQDHGFVAAVAKPYSLRAMSVVLSRVMNKELSA